MFPFGLAALGDELYTFDQVADVIRRLDGTSGETLETIDVGIRETGEGSLAIGRDAIGYISGRNNLYRFDLATGTSSIVGTVSRMDGLAIGPDNILYGLEESTYRLFVIDTDTAEATLVGPTDMEPPSFNFTGGLAVGLDGEFHATNDTELYRLDPSTGAATVIGVVGWFDLQGLAWLDCQPPVALQPGDADQNLEFSGEDLIRVMSVGKYLTEQSATWGEGDWDGGPAGRRGRPPEGNGMFNQHDIIAALRTGLYETGGYAATGERAWGREAWAGRQISETNLTHVPEPATILLLFVALGVTAWQRNAVRRRS
jgi:hypothetical protein